MFDFWRHFRKASSKPPQVLYKYMRIGTAGPTSDFDQKNHGGLASLLTDGILYVPAVCQFNDPWEARPWFRASPGQESRELAEFFARMNPQGNGTGGWTPHIIDQIRREIEEHGIEAVLSKTQSQLSTRLECNRVLCLAEKPDIALMWSYYAGGHSGVVIEFDATIMPFLSAQRVRYQTDYPSIVLNQAHMPRHALERALLTKGRFWRHEREWRVIGTSKNEVFEWDSGKDVVDVRDSMFATGRYAVLPKGAVRRIIIGARAHPPVPNKILALASRCDPPIPVVQCRLGASAFKVIIPDKPLTPLQSYYSGVWTLPASPETD